MLNFRMFKTKPSSDQPDQLGSSSKIILDMSQTRNIFFRPGPGNYIVRAIFFLIVNVIFIFIFCKKNADLFDKSQR